MREAIRTHWQLQIPDFRHLLRKEILPPVEQNVVRVHALRLNNSERTFTPITPDLNSFREAKRALAYPKHPLYGRFGTGHSEKLLATTLFDGVCSLDNLFFTSSIWAAKRADAVNPDQVVLSGGKMGINHDENRPETVGEAAVRQLAGEGHFYGLVPADIKLIAQRDYSFLHPHYKGGKPTTIVNHETITEAEVAPFLEARFYDPEDKLSEPIIFSPKELQMFLATGKTDRIAQYSLKHFTLLDSLWENAPTRKKARVETDGRESEIRDRLTLGHYAFEVRTRIELTEHLLSMTHPKHAELLRSEWRKLKKSVLKTHDLLNLDQAISFMRMYRQFLRKFEHTYSFTDDQRGNEQKAKRYLNQFFPAELVTALTESEVTTERLWQRALIVGELRQALQRVTFDHSLAFIKNAGPQKPFLLAQIIQNLDTITNYEYRKIKEFKEVASLFEIGAKAFGINIEDDPDWYEKLRERIRLYRNLKLKQRSKHKTFEESDDYEELNFDLHSEYAKSLGVTVDEIAVLSNGANTFLEYSTQPLDLIIDQDVKMRLLPDWEEIGTKSFDELYMRLFGFDQYDPAFDNLPADKRIEAWVKILLMRNVKDVHAVWKNHLQTPLYFFRSAFNNIIHREQVGSETYAPNITFPKYKLSVPIDGEFQLPFTFNTNIKFADFPAIIASEPHDKEFISALRKYLERSGPTGEFRIQDFFGRMIIIDVNAFQTELASRFPLQTIARLLPMEEITKKWLYAVAKAIVKSYKEQLEEWGFAYQTDREREEGAFQGVLAEAGIETNYPTQRHEIGASKPKWDWLKFVHKIHRNDTKVTSEELQILHQAREKFADDKRYRLESMFEVRRAGYFPSIQVFFGIQKDYDEVVRSRYQGIVFAG